MPSTKVYEKVKSPQILTCVLLFLILLSFYTSVEAFINEKIVDPESSSAAVDKTSSLLYYTQRRTLKMQGNLEMQGCLSFSKGKFLISKINSEP